MATRYRHSAADVWRARIQAGELDCNGQVLSADYWLSGAEQILWRRPPWREEAIPDRWDTLHDDGDLLVINKPSGLPVIPGGGFLRHTLTALLEPSGAPQEPSRTWYYATRTDRLTSLTYVTVHVC